MSALLIPTVVPTQDALGGTMTMGLGDVAAIKARAEAGDAAAQVALGDALASQFH